MKEHIRFLWGVILSILCFFACTNKQEDIELFLKKEIVKEFANKGIDAKILKNSLKLVSDGEGKFKGSVSVVIDNEVYEHDLSVLIEEESVQWQMEETEASVKKRAQKREELQRQETQRQEMAQRRLEETQRREEKARDELMQAQRREEEYQRQINQKLLRIEDIENRLTTLFAIWSGEAFYNSRYSTDPLADPLKANNIIYALRNNQWERLLIANGKGEILNLKREADRLFSSLSQDQSINQQLLNQERNYFNYWFNDMINNILKIVYADYIN